MSVDGWYCSESVNRGVVSSIAYNLFTELHNYKWAHSPGESWSWFLSRKPPAEGWVDRMYSRYNWCSNYHSTSTSKIISRWWKSNRVSVCNVATVSLVYSLSIDRRTLCRENRIMESIMGMWLPNLSPTTVEANLCECFYRRNVLTPLLLLWSLH